MIDEIERQRRILKNITVVNIIFALVGIVLYLLETGYYSVVHWCWKTGRYNMGEKLIDLFPRDVLRVWLIFTLSLGWVIILGVWLFIVGMAVYTLIKRKMNRSVSKYFGKLLFINVAVDIFWLFSSVTMAISYMG